MCKTIEITEKRCSKCGEVKPVEEFYKRKKGPFGLNSECKQCGRNRNAKYHAENSDKIAIRKAKYYEKNKVKKIDYASKWYYQNRKKMLEYHSKYRNENREYMVKRKAKCRAKNIRNLEEPYIKNLLSNYFGITYSEITPELIELKRISIQSKRILNHKKLKV